jgi:anti-anti-sigma factor
VITESDAGVLVSPVGDLDMATAETLATQAGLVLARSPRCLTLDLSGVPFCDSAGINVLVRLRNASDREKSDFRLINPQPHVRMVLEITGVAEFLNLASADAGV